MAQDVNILTWNIQNYGRTKASFDDVMNAIATFVIFQRPDIFVLLELNTTDNTTATNLAKRMAQVLYAKSKSLYGGTDYRVCTISPNTGLEFYGFFIRDHTTTIPLLAKKRSDNSSVTNIGESGLGYNQVQFVSPPIAAGINVLRNFALLSPDVVTYSKRGRDLGVPNWPGTRYPALGTFWCTGATGDNRLLPIFACHFAADHTQAAQQVDRLDNYSLLRGLGPAPPNTSVPTQAPIVMRTVRGGTTVDATVQSYVLTGDFNLNYLSTKEIKYYNPITGNIYPQLNDKLFIKVGTHLVTYANYSPRDFKTTKELAVNGYDNLMLGVNPGSLNKASGLNGEVVNMPESIRTRTVQLYECVAHYRELDKRGFDSGDYNNMATDFAKQLIGDKSHLINLAGSLVGGRLVSDHLPVKFTLKLK